LTTSQLVTQPPSQKQQAPANGEIARLAETRQETVSALYVDPKGVSVQTGKYKWRWWYQDSEPRSRCIEVQHQEQWHRGQQVPEEAVTNCASISSSVEYFKSLGALHDLPSPTISPPSKTTRQGLERRKQNDNAQQKPSIMEITNTYNNKQDTEVVHYCRGYTLETIQYINIEDKAKCERGLRLLFVEAIRRFADATSRSLP
jgi:hypothetical protein